MCLHSIRTHSRSQIETTKGWKVFRWNRRSDGGISLYALHNSYCFRVGGLNDASAAVLHANDGQCYPAGFHVYQDELDARYEEELNERFVMCTNEVILPVTIYCPLVAGKQLPQDVGETIVCSRLTIDEEAFNTWLDDHNET